jgi:dolichyl-phosphate-mannose--protein O-mannosyl transferase
MDLLLIVYKKYTQKFYLHEIIQFFPETVQQQLSSLQNNNKDNDKVLEIHNRIQQYFNYSILITQY